MKTHTRSPLALPALVLASALALATLAPLAAQAATSTAVAPSQITEYPVPVGGQPGKITVGPDANVWFTDGGSNKIGKITPTGTITEYALPTVNSGLGGGIAAGPDGNVWFTEEYSNKVGKITPTGTITEYAIPTANSALESIVAGPDGNLWFVETIGNIGKITPAGTITEYPVAIDESLGQITVGQDGNLWFTTAGGPIDRITPAGVITEYPIATTSGPPAWITAGPDGNLWFTEDTGGNHPGVIGKFTLSGVMTEYPVPVGGQPGSVTAGPDGNVWFTDGVTNKIGKVTPTGTITEYAFSTVSSALGGGITAGPDGNMWFSENGAIGKFTLSRLSGSDRFATSAAISAASFAPGVPVAYVANGYNFPDALSAAPVAGKGGAPVLLVSADAIPAVIQAELTRLKPGRIVVLGGVNAVSDAVKSALQSSTAGTVTRLSGTDRFATSAAISAAAFTPGVPIAYIANGYNFPDALSAAPVAGKGGAPVLLVSADAIPAVIQAELNRLKPGRIVVLGGVNAVSDVVESALQSSTVGTVTRLSGSDRFATSAAISAAAFAPGVPVVYVANGYNFPDALSAAPVAGMGGAPVLLVSADAIPAVIQAELTRLKPGRIVVLGGVNAVSDSVSQQLTSYISK